MKLTTEEALVEIHKRGREIKHIHERRVLQGLSATAFVLTFVLLGVLGHFTGIGTTAAMNAYGSFLLPASAGGYVLTAVIAFALGVVVTVLAKKSRKDEEDSSEKDR